MLRFQLFGFPVRVEWFFWLLCLILGMRHLERGGPEGVALFVIVAAIVFVSIIWHELGHAWARKRFGAAYSEITLHGFGGLCSGPGHFTRTESILISAAGPVFSLALGGAFWLVREIYPPMPAESGGFSTGTFIYASALGTILWVNIGWAIINLFPIYPLDGGQIAAAAFPRHFRTVLWIGVILAAGFALYGFLVWKSVFSAFLFGMLAWGNWQRLQGQRSGF